MLPFQQGLQETAIAAALLLVASPVHPFLLELECWEGQEQWQVTQEKWNFGQSQSLLLVRAARIF